MHSLFINVFLAVLGLLVLFFDVKSETKITRFGYFFIFAFTLGLFANFVVSHLTEEEALRVQTGEQEKILQLKKQVGNQASAQKEAAVEAARATDKLQNTVKKQQEQLVTIKEEFSLLVTQHTKLSTNYNQLVEDNQSLSDDNMSLANQITRLGGQLTYQTNALQREARKQTRLAEEQKRRSEAELERQRRCRFYAQFNMPYPSNC